VNEIENIIAKINKKPLNGKHSSRICIKYSSNDDVNDGEVDHAIKETIKASPMSPIKIRG
jgi:hypothetical protein